MNFWKAISMFGYTQWLPNSLSINCPLINYQITGAVALMGWTLFYLFNLSQETPDESHSLRNTLRETVFFSSTCMFPQCLDGVS